MRNLFQAPRRESNNYNFLTPGSWTLKVKKTPTSVVSAIQGNSPDSIHEVMDHGEVETFGWIVEADHMTNNHCFPPLTKNVPALLIMLPIKLVWAFSFSFWITAWVRFVAPVRFRKLHRRKWWTVSPFFHHFPLFHHHPRQPPTYQQNT